MNANFLRWITKYESTHKHGALKCPAGAKARSISASNGTTEVVPCYLQRLKPRVPSRPQPNQRNRHLRIRMFHLIRQLAAHHGDLVAAVQIRAVDAVFRNLVG